MPSWLTRLSARLGMASELPSGIVWVGPVFDVAGYANVSRNYVLGLDALDVPLRVVNHGITHRKLLPRDVYERLRRLTKGNAGPNPVAIIHYVPDEYTNISVPDAIARVGVTIFETDRIPEHWVSLCNAMDAIWVPSEFNRGTFIDSGVSREKLDVVPYAVDTSYFAPIDGTFDVPGLRDFTFLYVSFFDWRKGFDLMLEAYLSEFTKRDNVSLVIRTSFIGRNESESVRERLYSMIGDRVNLSREDLPHLALITDPLCQDDLRRLYNTCDLYISTDRANGWGMPCMEAMAMGKPAATIDWSGSTQFMTDGNSLLIRPTGRLEPVDPRLQEERGGLYSGHRWAEVEVGAVRRTMRYAFENRDELKVIAERGCCDVRSKFNLACVAAQLAAAADRVRERGRDSTHLG